MKEQIQKLVADGKVEEALRLLAEHDSDAILLLARYNNGKKQYNMGLISYSEWQQIQNQVSFAALEMAGRVFPASGASVPQVSTSPARSAAPQVFISYNHKDAIHMHAVRGYLEKNDIQVFVDVANMAPGEDIQRFIDKAFKENHFVLSLVSENSLLSGWVSKEINAAILLNRLASKWIPVMLDQSFFDPSFYFTASEHIEAKIGEVREHMKKALDADMDTRPFEEEMGRLRDLKANLGPTLESLKKVLVTDISGAMFEPGMQKVLQAIQSPG